MIWVGCLCKSYDGVFKSIRGKQVNDSIVYDANSEQNKKLLDTAQNRACGQS